MNEDLRNRTKEFALQIIKPYGKMPKTDATRIIGKQLLRSGTSVAANFRAVSRSRSDKERFAKLSIVVEEADESHFWIELLEESGLVNPTLLVDIKEEALQLTKIFSSYRKKLKS